MYFFKSKKMQFRPTSRIFSLTLLVEQNYIFSRQNEFLVRQKDRAKKSDDEFLKHNPFDHYLTLAFT
jgi:hypothetical protein